MASILIVDDNCESCELMAKLLRGLGHVVFCVNEGSLTMGAVRHHRPDLMLLDIRLKDMDGLAVLRQVRADPKWQALAVVMLSGVRDAWVQAEALSLGASDYILKGWDWQRMLERIEHNLPGAFPGGGAAG